MIDTKTTALKDAIEKVIETLKAANEQTELPYHLLGEREHYKAALLDARAHIVRAESLLKALKEEV